MTRAYRLFSGPVSSNIFRGSIDAAHVPFSATGINSIQDTFRLRDPACLLNDIRIAVYDTATGTFSAHDQEKWLHLVNSVSCTALKPGESLAAIFGVLANRYDWWILLGVTGPRATESMMAEIGTLLTGKDNTTSATFETLESPRWLLTRSTATHTRR